MSDLTEAQIVELTAMMADAWPAPWTARTFEIDCPCPNGEHCGDSHTCEAVEAPEAYPASHEEPAAEGEGQCVVQISVPGLESLAGPTARFIAAARNALPSLLAEVRRLRSSVPGTTETGTREEVEAARKEARVQRLRGAAAFWCQMAAGEVEHKWSPDACRALAMCGKSVLYVLDGKADDRDLPAPEPTLPVSRGEAPVCARHPDEPHRMFGTLNRCSVCGEPGTLLRSASPPPGSETPRSRPPPRCKSCGQDLIEGFHYATIQRPAGSETPRGKDLGTCAYCNRRPATHTAKHGAQNLRPACDTCDAPASPPPSETPRGAGRCAKCGCDAEHHFTDPQGIRRCEGEGLGCGCRGFVAPAPPTSPGSATRCAKCSGLGGFSPYGNPQTMDRYSIACTACNGTGRAPSPSLPGDNHAEKEE